MSTAPNELYDFKNDPNDTTNLYESNSPLLNELVSYLRLLYQNHINKVEKRLNKITPMQMSTGYAATTFANKKNSFSLMGMLP